MPPRQKKPPPAKQPATTGPLPQIYRILDKSLTNPYVKADALTVHQTHIKLGKKSTKASIDARAAWTKAGGKGEKPPLEKKIPDMKGLFATRLITRGEFLGYYMGFFYVDLAQGDPRIHITTAADIEDMKAQFTNSSRANFFYTGRANKLKNTEESNAQYALGVGDNVVIDPPKQKGAVDPVLFPMSMMNEPPKGQESNAQVIPWTNNQEAVPGLEPSDGKVYVAAIHACRDIQEGEEIYFHYGRDFNGSYERGKACKPIKEKEIRDEEKPRQVMERQGTATVPHGLVYVTESAAREPLEAAIMAP